MPVERVRTLHVDEESAYRTEPSANGSGYAAVQLDGIPIPARDLKMEPTQYAVGRNAATEEIPTIDSTSFDFTWIPAGFATSAGDGVAPPATDGADWLVSNALGQPFAAIPGEGVNAGSGAGNLILDALIATLEADMPVPVWFTAAGRVIWRYVLSAAGEPTYTIAPNWAASPGNPTTSEVLYGTRLWAQTDDLQAQGATLASAFELDGTIVGALGGRHRSFALESPAGGRVVARSTIRYDSFQNDTSTKTALPAVTTFPSGPRGVYSPLFFNGTAYAASAPKLDFGLSSAAFESTEGANGSTDDQVLAIDPVIEFDPGFALSTWHDAWTNQTIAPVLLQMGGGTSTTRVNSWAFFAPRVQVVSVRETGRAGYLRHTVRLKILDSGTAGRIRWVLARS